MSLDNKLAIVGAMVFAVLTGFFLGRWTVSTTPLPPCTADAKHVELLHLHERELSMLNSLAELELNHVQLAMKTAGDLQHVVTTTDACWIGKPPQEKR